MTAAISNMFIQPSMTGIKSSLFLLHHKRIGDLFLTEILKYVKCCQLPIISAKL